MSVKYLLPYTVNRNRKGGLVKIEPGCASLIKLANKHNLIKAIDREYDKEHDHWVIKGYIIDEKNYSWLKLSFKADLENKRKKFYAQDPLIQVVQILKYIFKRNLNAKEVDKYGRSMSAYRDKELFLKLALDITKNVRHQFFSYGYAIDRRYQDHQLIYYFEIKELGQVSFHSDISYDNVPKFQGDWIGVKNENFPFNIKDINKLIKINGTKLKN